MDGKENVPEKLAGGGKATLSRCPLGGPSNKDARRGPSISSWLFMQKYMKFNAKVNFVSTK